MGSRENRENPYADILDLPHHVSKRHQRMSLSDRAAQFSPFAALRGYEDALRESTRVTEERRDPGPDLRDEMDAELHRAAEALAQGKPPEVRATCFVPDGRKSGGSHEVICGAVTKLDMASGVIYIGGTAVELSRMVEFFLI